MVGFKSRRFWVESSAIAHHYSVSEFMRSQSQKKASNLRGRMQSLSWSPNGQTLATSSHDQTAKLWDINTGQCLKTLQGHKHWVWSVRYHQSHPVRMVKPWLVSVQTKLRSCRTPTQVNASKPCKVTRIWYHQSHGVGMVKPSLLAAQMRQSSFGMWIRVSA
jgi:WD40 repeat protein